MRSAHVPVLGCGRRNVRAGHRLRPLGIGKAQFGHAVVGRLAVPIVEEGQRVAVGPHVLHDVRTAWTPRQRSTTSAWVTPLLRRAIVNVFTMPAMSAPFHRTDRVVVWSGSARRTGEHQFHTHVGKTVRVVARRVVPFVEPTGHPQKGLRRKSRLENSQFAGRLASRTASMR